MQRRAMDPAMKIGIVKYKEKNYSEAAGYFGMALQAEFNNPSLHYHLANCMVHMRQKDVAIREYRIAYALYPTGTIAKYSQMCLAKFGIDATGTASSIAALSAVDEERHYRRG